MSRLDVAGLCAAILAIVLGVFLLVPSHGGPSTASCCNFGGAAFGMTAEQLRAQFVGGDRGRWSKTVEGKRVVWTWERTANDPSLPISARFDLHDGLVTGVHALLDPKSEMARGAAFDATPLSVTARRPRADGTIEFVSLVRDCGEEAPEIAAILERRAHPATSVVAP